MKQSNNVAMKQFHLLIQGDVQGVGFRSWVRREAQKLHLVGWVKNREDESVEVVAQGTETDVQHMTELCKKGPEVAWVEKVEVREESVDKDLFVFEVY